MCEKMIKLFETSDQLIINEIEAAFKNNNITYEVKNLQNTAFYKSGLGVFIAYIDIKDKKIALELLNSIINRSADPDFETNIDVGFTEIENTTPQIRIKSFTTIIVFIFFLAVLILISKLT